MFNAFIWFDVKRRLTSCALTYSIASSEWNSNDTGLGSRKYSCNQCDPFHLVLLNTWRSCFNHCTHIKRLSNNIWINFIIHLVLFFIILALFKQNLCTISYVANKQKIFIPVVKDQWKIRRYFKQKAKVNNSYSWPETYNNIFDYDS